MTCPDCGHPMDLIDDDEGGDAWWVCDECGIAVPDLGG